MCLRRKLFPDALVTWSPFTLFQIEGFIAPLDRMLGSIPEPQQSKEEDVAIVQKISWLLSVLLEWQVWMDRIDGWMSPSVDGRVIE